MIDKDLLDAISSLLDAKLEPIFKRLNNIEADTAALKRELSDTRGDITALKNTLAGVKAEGGPLNRAPRNSILAETLTLQALSVALQVEKDWDPIKYVRCHPGGKLGELRENEK